MLTDTAIALIDGLVYRPGWEITARPHTKRFEGTICVHIEYPAQNTDRDQAPDYPHDFMARAEFPIICANCENDIALYRELLKHFMTIEEHEAREYLRVRTTLWAPFHPHRADGMTRWGDPQGDLTFGIV